MKAKMVEVQELLSDDLELLLREIDEFCGAAAKGIEQNIPESIENYLVYVSKTGNTIFPWQNIRPLFRLKLKSAIAQFQGEPSSIEPYVYERFDLFRSAPFTIQRLSELITTPNRHYKIKDKFVSALEKTVFVVSTIEPTLPQDNDNFTNGSEENNTSSSEDGLNHEMSITFDGTPQHSDYNNSIGIELPSMPMNSSENEAMKMDPDSIGDAVVSESLASLDPSASGDNGNGVPGSGLAPSSENHGFTTVSESAALIHEDDRFQIQNQNNAYDHAEGDLNVHTVSLINPCAENVAASATSQAVAQTEAETGIVASASNINVKEVQPTSEALQPAATTSDPTSTLTADQPVTHAADPNPVFALETPAAASASESAPVEQAAAPTESSKDDESVAVTQVSSVPDSESIDSTS